MYTLLASSNESPAISCLFAYTRRRLRNSCTLSCHQLPRSRWSALLQKASLIHPLDVLVHAHAGSRVPYPLIARAEQVFAARGAWMTLCYGPGTDCRHSDDDAHASYDAAQLWLHILLPTGEVPSRETKVVVASQSKESGRNQPSDRNVKEINGTTPLVPRAAVTDVLVRPARASRIWAGVLAQPPCWFWSR